MTQEANINTQQRDWWAQGDTPVRANDSLVTYLVDGRQAMWTICRHCIKAQKYIYLANWGMTAKMELVRGDDYLGGPDGSPQRAALIEGLRVEGFSEADIQFWLTHNLSVQAVLGYARSKGVEVKVLLWHSQEAFSHYQPLETKQELEAVGVHCILDDSARGLVHHPVESLHQKTAVIDGTHAFVGGVDLLIEKQGDYDRWDTPMHAFNTPLRLNEQQKTPHPWHDVHSLIEGCAAGDVEFNFRQRWNDVVARQRLDTSFTIPERPLPLPVQGAQTVQVVRTIPQHTYDFDPDPGLQDIAQVYAKALGNIQRFAYLENQYLWLRAFIGVDLPLIGSDSPDMETNLRTLGAALQRGAFASIILPDHPNVGRAFSDAGLQRLHAEAPQAFEEGRFEAFCLGSSGQIDGKVHYRPIYVHAKVAIIDDLWSTVGSANLNNRGMRDDTEINVAVLDSRLARNLRLLLQGEHLGLVQDADLFVLSRLLSRQHLSASEQERAVYIHDYLEERLSEPRAALQAMHECAWNNLQRYKENQPLIGHLLPYLSAAEATNQGLNFREEHGWLEEEAQK
ncbi:phospholipase [Ktedonobacter sp. SOSP1-52]|uniref:phospholipase D-like domain-containing protein n=1 Tax=Ktedonobacter sp. SOSP1-52 TaxID=2778366 RepID=UPI00191543EC|nr:phospholipase D family protein [Ktedonobacter sp. SOSP1-52]GHO70541.1 phospholipase [Ktedonobacter sp. SOSP1-52]